MADVQTIARHIPDRLESRGARLIKSWETLLVAVALAIFVVNSFASPYFLDPWNLSDATFNFTEKAMIAFAMALVIISGEIDLSVASIIALTSTVMGYAVQLGFDTPALVMIGLATGLLCGAFNGLLVTGLGLPSIVVTIGTMSLRSERIRHPVKIHIVLAEAFGVIRNSFTQPSRMTKNASDGESC